MIIFLFRTLFGFHFIALCLGQNDMGPGIWSLISLGQCPNEDESYVAGFTEIEKHKINRTHDGISCKMSTTDEINGDYGVYIEVCKYVEGGCKDYQVLSDNNVASFTDKYVKENKVVAFKMANLDPPDFPIPKGDYEVKDFVVDYCEIPRDAVYGKYEALAYLTYDSEKVGCCKVVIEFNEFQDENYCDQE